MVIKRILSLGMGVQSTALYYMSCMGIYPRLDAAIFVDTGREKSGTLRYLEYLQDWAEKNNGIPIIVVRRKNLFKDLLDSENSTGQKFSAIPAFTMNEKGKVGMLRRQCTKEYKIEQVDAAIREFVELKRISSVEIEVWKGISYDEIDRMSVPQHNWKHHVYPFCGYIIHSKGHIKLLYKVIRRPQIIQWFIDHGLTVPPKSACVFCPYQSDASWYEMMVNEPEDFAAAILVDRAMRDSTKKGVKQQAFLHKSCVPLEEIEFKPQSPDMWFGECSGGCHT